ncbi:MAG: TPM domain-containing protein [Muribaculaceae bacterium]|nr:TPM domain-containing protein [Muribaculaceae bacterium]
MIKHLLTLLLLVTALLRADAYTVQQIPNVHLQDSRRYTSDPDGVLSVNARLTIDSLAADLRANSSSELAVVIVNSIDGADPEQFATELFNNWRIGKKESNNGVLVLTVMDENYCIIRTGYGAEGVLPDITTGRIRREIMNPYFREGQTDSAMVAGIRAIHDVMTDPDAASELIDTYTRNREESQKEETRRELLQIVVGLALMGAAASLIIILVYFSNNKKYGNDITGMFKTLTNLQAAALAASFLGLGIPLLVFAYLRIRRNRLRNTPPVCAACGATMRKVSADKHRYLNPQQQVEQRLGSADYDVWICPVDGNTEIREYPGPSNTYSRCPNCGTRARHLVSDKVIQQPTAFRNGQGQRRYHCEYCGKDDFTNYTIMRQTPIVIGGRGGGRGFGGGGFSGGSFGGGFSGGGGSGGRW